ncbi:MAG: hypothetical protein R6X21_07055 [Candidatus Aminicenantes bacterium]
MDERPNGKRASGVSRRDFILDVLRDKLDLVRAALKEAVLAVAG